MYRNILVPVDGSELSEKAVKECIGLVKSTGAKVMVFYVVSHFQLHYRFHAHGNLHKKIEKEHEEEARQFAEKMVTRLAESVKSEGIDCEGMVVIGDHPYEEIIGNAEKRKCDLIIMASHGRRGLDAALLGSETVKVLTHSKIPVLVVR